MVVAMPAADRRAIGGTRVSTIGATLRQPPDRVQRARAGAVAFGAIGVVLVFALGGFAGGISAGVMAALLVVANPLYRIHATRAMPDIHYCLLLVAVGVMAALMLRPRVGPRVPTRLLVVAGFLGGLSASMKVTGLVVAAATLGATLVCRAVVLRGPLRELIRSTAIVVGTMVLTHFSSNPFYWPDRRLIELRQLAQEIASLSAADLRNLNAGSICEPVLRPQIANLCNVIALPQMLPAWQARLTTVAPVGPRSYWRQHRLRALHAAFLKTYATVPYEWLLVPFGAFFCLSRLVRSIRLGRTDPACAPLLFFGANYGLIVVFLPLDWDRYYLTMVVATKVMIALGVWWLVSLALAAMTSKSSEASDLEQ
jgi:hypothetical protein